MEQHVYESDVTEDVMTTETAGKIETDPASETWPAPEAPASLPQRVAPCDVVLVAREHFSAYWRLPWSECVEKALAADEEEALYLPDGMTERSLSECALLRRGFGEPPNTCLYRQEW